MVFTTRPTWPIRAIGPLVCLFLPIGRAEAAQAIPLELTEVRSIGVAGGDSRYEFGSIDAVAVAEPERTMFVLDRLNHRLSAFTAAGNHIASAGREGFGPGEFQWLSALLLTDSGATVIDAASGRISTWILRDDSLSMVSESTSAILLETRDACMVANDIMLLRASDGTIIQRVTVHGERLGSFGTPLVDSPHPMMAAATTFGYLACDQSNQSVYVAGSLVPVVRRYSTAGSLLWEATIPEMHPVVITPAGAGIQYNPPAGRQYSHVVVSLFVLSDSMIGVQFGESRPGASEPADIVDVTTVVFSAVDGSVRWQGRRVPRIDMIQRGRAYAHPTDPFPQVKIYEWR